MFEEGKFGYSRMYFSSVVCPFISVKDFLVFLFFFGVIWETQMDVL